MLNSLSKSQIMLAYTRDDVLELNQLVRGLRKEQKELGNDVLFQTERGERVFAVHDRVYFLKNDKSLGVMNGTLGTIEAIKDNALTVRLDLDGREKCHRQVTITMERYNQIEYGYAATIHKAQGVTVDRSYVLASKYLDAHSTYVAMSRHRESSDLFYGKDVFLNRDDLAKTLSRERPKDVTLDYLNTNSREEVLSLSPDSLVKKDLDQGNSLLQENERAIRQAKLREFTEQAIALRASRGIKGSLIKTEKTRPDLGEFKKQFEEKHPERAQALRNEIAPAHEKKALSLIAEFKRLEEIIEKGGRSKSMAEGRLHQLADKMSRQKEVMEYVRAQDALLEKNVKELAKEFHRGRDFGLER